MGYAELSANFALTNVIFGQYNPFDAVPEPDMQMTPSPTNPGRTYKFYTGQPVFEFGYSLSYTKFNYSLDNQTIDSIISIESLENKILFHFYSANITNAGEMAGSDNVLAFLTPLQQSLNDPSPAIKKLFDFQYVYLDINQTIQIHFPLKNHY